MARKPLKINFVVNLISPLIRLAVALVTVPIYIRHVGEARYGVISIVWILLGYFGFLDLGLSRASTNALAKLRDAPQADRARVLLTTYALNLGFGLIGAGLLAVVGEYLFQYVLSIPEDLKPEIARALPWIACLFPMLLISGVGVGALESRERFLLANAFQVLSLSLSQIAPVIVAVYVSPSLAFVVPSAAIAQAVSMAGLLIYVLRLEGPFSFRTFDRAEARKLLGYGGWITVSTLINPFLVAADQFLIGTVIGVVEVAKYAVAMNLVLRTQALPAAMGRTFFPRMSSISRAEALALSARALSWLAYGYAMVCAPLILLAPVFFRYWIGPEFALAAAPVAKILVLGAWANGLALVAYTLIQGQGRPDITGRLHMAEVLPFLVILWILTTTLGINGAAIAWSLRCTVDALALFWLAGIGKGDVALLLRPASFLAATQAVAYLVGANFAPAFLATIFISLIGLGMACLFSEDWRKSIIALLVRARVLSESLMNRAKPAPPINPNVQK